MRVQTVPVSLVAFGLLILFAALLGCGRRLLHHILISRGHQQAVGSLEVLHMLYWLSILIFTHCSSAVLLGLLWNQFRLAHLSKLIIPLLSFELNFFGEARRRDMLTLADARLHGGFVSVRTLLNG